MSNLPILPRPDDSLKCFEKLKQVTNKSWRRIEIVDNCYGLQMQSRTKWRNGLSETTLAEFEKAMGYTFPTPLKNYYLTMNGLDTPGIDVQGSHGDPPRYGAIYYSYPDDLDKIKETIEWVLDANHVALEDLPAKASRIFPVKGHRFLLIDDPKLRVLSMHGDDIIYWSNGVSGLLIREEFPGLYHNTGFARFGTRKGI
jgi:hypothetical protein